MILESKDSNDIGKFEQECRGYPIHLVELEENSTLIDAGANLGGFIRVWGNKFNKIIAIEASKNNFTHLKENTKELAQEIEITYLNLAVEKEDNKIVKLKSYTHENGKDTGCGNYGITDFVYSSVNHGWKEADGFEEVSTVSLETLLNQLDRVDLLKVDVEGAEFNFLFQKDLKKITYIVMELHNFLRFDNKQQQLLDHLLKTHVEIYSVGNGVDSHFVKLFKKREQ